MPRRSSLLASLGLVTSLVLPSTGCYGDVESFAKTASKHSCKRLRECDKADFDEEYGGDLERCRDQTYTDFLDAYDLAQELNCVYDSDEGKRCGSAIKSLKNDCSDEADQDIVDECAEIFDCPGGVALDPPATGPAADIVVDALASWPDDDAP